MKNLPRLTKGTIITITGTVVDGTYEIEHIEYGDYHLRNVESDKALRLTVSAIDSSIGGVVTVNEED